MRAKLPLLLTRFCAENLTIPVLAIKAGNVKARTSGQNSMRQNVEIFYGVSIQIFPGVSLTLKENKSTNRTSEVRGLWCSPKKMRLSVRDSEVQYGLFFGAP